MLIHIDNNVKRHFIYGKNRFETILSFKSDSSKRMNLIEIFKFNFKEVVGLIESDLNF